MAEEYNPLKGIHIIGEPQRHSAVPYLWRITCSCKWSALSATKAAAEAAKKSHYDEYVNPQVADEFREMFGEHDDNLPD